MQQRLLRHSFLVSRNDKNISTSSSILLFFYSMKIWIDCRMFSTSFTGIWRHVYELVRYLEEHDKDNDYVLFMNNPEYAAYTPGNPRFQKVLVGARHYSYAEQVKFLYLLYREKLDLIHFTSFNSPILYFRPSIVTIHDLTISFYPGRKMTGFHHRLGYNLTIKTAVRRAKKVIAVSANTKKDIIEALGVRDDAIEVIYNGINAKDYQSASETDAKKVREKYDLKNPYFLYIGVWRDHKNMPRMLKAYAEALKGWLDVDMVIAGREDPVYREVRDTIVAENLQKRVRILGFVEEQDLIALYRDARAYILPSLYEGFGLQILESMAAGVPVISSNVSSMPEVAGKEWALFFKPISIESIKKAMLDIDRDEALRQKLIEFGKKRVLDFSWEKMGKETLAIYKNILWH